MRSHTKVFIITSAIVAAMAMPAVAQAAEAVAIHSGTMRAGPESDFPAVDHISSGDDLEVYGCTDGYEWCDVSDGDNRGWFQGSRIAFVRDGRREIITDVGAAVGIGIVGFALDDYWGAHYHSRPFFRQEHTFQNRWHPNPGNHPHVNNPPPHVNNPPPHFNNQNNQPHVQQHVTPHVNTPHIQPHVNTPHIQPHVNTPHIQPHVNTPHVQPHVNTPHNAPPPIDNHKPL
jgi:uncharacterized protein YraI